MCFFLEAFMNPFLFYLTHRRLRIRCYDCGHLKLVMSKKISENTAPRLLPQYNLPMLSGMLPLILTGVTDKLKDSLPTSPHMNLHIQTTTSTSMYGNAILPG